MDHQDFDNELKKMMQAFEPAHGCEPCPELIMSRGPEVNWQLHSKPKPRTQLQQYGYERQHRLPVGNTSAEITFVNDNPGKKIVLYAEGGGYIVSWYYGQTENGEFYKQAFVGFDQKEETYYLDGPLDPEKVCADSVQEETYLFPAPLKVCLP